MTPGKKTFTVGGETVELPASFTPRVLGMIGFVVLLIIIFAGSVYQIDPEEVGIILRFGKYVRTTDPGLHMKMPFGIEQLKHVPIQRQLKMEFGFRTTRAGIRSQYQKSAITEKESIMLTGDLNVAVVEWIVQYKIKDPYKYLFKLRDPESTFRFMTEAVMRTVIGDNSVDEVITIGRSRIANEAKISLQELCDKYEIGIEVNQLIFQDVNPPDNVKASFNEVNEALQEKERKINEAFTDYNQVIPLATGQALQVVEEAEGYALERVNQAQGDAKRFRSIYKEYARAPIVTKKRLYLETMRDILPKVRRKVFLDDSQKNLLPLLNLAQEVK